MSASTVAMIGALVDAHRELTPVLAEHLKDMEGEILPHLVMADIVRWLAIRVESEESFCKAVLDWLELEFSRGPEDVQGLISVSCVEMIPDPGQPGSRLRDLLGPNLKAMDSWSVASPDG